MASDRYGFALNGGISAAASDRQLCVKRRNPAGLQSRRVERRNLGDGLRSRRIKRRNLGDGL